MNKISDGELEVMKSLWAGECPRATWEISQELKKKMGWENSTVRTFIRRLIKKGFIIQEKKEKSEVGGREVFYYSPAICEEKYMKEKTRDFVKKMYRGNAKELVACLFNDKLLSSDDIDELKSFWDDVGGKLDE